MAYNIRDIDGSADNAIQPVALHYRVGDSGDFTNLPDGFVADATTGPNLADLVTPVSVTLPSAANNQSIVQIRIMTADAPGADEWVGIDDISITADPAEPELAISKIVDPATAVPFQSPVTYTVVLQNNGGMADTAVLFTDTLPISTTFGAWVEQPAGASEAGNEITWSGTVTNGESITFTFTADQTGDYGDTITNTAEYSGTTTTGTAQAAFTVESLEGDITFVYYDLEDVVQPGEGVFLAGDFNGWNLTSTLMTADAANNVFTVTLTAVPAGTYEYLYLVYTDTVPTGAPSYNLLSTNNRSYTVAGTATVNDYRNVVIGWANLQWPPTLETDMGVATDNVYGRVFVNTVTNPPGEGRGLKAQVGFGGSANPAAWTWFPMVYNVDDFDNDEFVGVMTPTLSGVYSYTTRFDGNWGSGNPNAAWTYGDLNGIPFSLDQTGVLTVNFAAVPIATARAGNLGEIFAVEGVVTYVPGTFNAQGWALQDASGGIGVFDNALVPAVDYGDTVQIIGVRGAFSGEEQLTALSFFNNVGPGPEVTPIITTTGSLAAGSGEGWIVEIQGTISSLPACTGNYQFLVDDGSGPVTVFVDADTGVNVCNLGAANGEEIRVVGFATQFNALNEVKPRRLSDVQVLLDAPVVLNTVPANNATGVATDATITIQFSEPVTVTANWFNLNCSLSGLIGGATTPAGPTSSYTITPASSFVNGDLCSVTVLADQVTNGSSQTMVANYNFSFLVGSLPFGVCGDSAVPINFVQGNGLVSPLVGTSVVVEGVVVGDHQATLNGYYIQEENADFDDDPMTSEGIFIYDPDNTPAVNNGDVVRIQATVAEFRGLTQLQTLSNISACGTDVVTPTVVTLPLAEADDWEWYEGMLIAIEDELTVTNNFYLGRFGQVRLSIGDRLAQPTNVVAPGATAVALQDLNNRSSVTLDDANPSSNVDPIVFPNPQLTFTNTLRGGDLVPGGIVGVVDHYNNDASDDYRVFPAQPVVFEHANTRPAMPIDVGGTLRVASFNVLNYFTTLDTGAPICGPQQNMGCRGANTALEFQRQRVKIINAIVALDADIVGLMEMENHFQDAALQNLVQGLNDAAGAGTYAYINTGVIGTDAIKVALIYQPANVTPAGAYAILDSAVDPTFIDTLNRPVLIQTFAENGTGELVTVAVNHLKSKGSACADDPDTGDGQGNCNLTRTDAATALVNYLATDPTGSGEARYLIIGDLNSYALEDPIVAIESAGYTNLIAQFQGPDAYGYTFEGQWGYLDHALASAVLTPFVTGAGGWHINSDEPVVLDYNMEFKTANQHVILFGEEAYRASDHDPVLIGLDLTAVVVTPTITILTPTNGQVYTSTNGTAVDVSIVITTTDFAIPADGHWHLWVDGVDTGPVLGYTATVALLPGAHVITAELNSPTHVSLGISDSVTVTMNVVYTLYLPVIMKP
ncbi:MAG: ExeM/NucH family extracellular endonuclease [Chloroflexi bacterium]|nr:ExeM/NucH family extracellular endonuclease [Chloroflexota bacterium]